MDDLLTLSEVMQSTRRSKASIYRDIEAGRLDPPVKTGPRSIRFRRTSLITWLNSRPLAELGKARSHAALTGAPK